MDSIVSRDRYHLHRRHQEPRIDLFLENGKSRRERAAGDMNWAIDSRNSVFSAFRIGPAASRRGLPESNEMAKTWNVSLARSPSYRL